MIFKFFYIKHNKFGRKGTINNNIDKTGFIYIKGYENLYMINNEGVIIFCSKISGNVVLKDRDLLLNILFLILIIIHKLIIKIKILLIVLIILNGVIILIILDIVIY